MRFIETPLPGAWVIEAERLGDERGWFARTFDADDFQSRGLNPAVVQCNASFNARTDTLRGMHYQSAPHGEPKLVRCVRGRSSMSASICAPSPRPIDAGMAWS